jgi:hypothetical protein
LGISYGRQNTGPKDKFQGRKGLILIPNQIIPYFADPFPDQFPLNALQGTELGLKASA